MPATNPWDEAAPAGSELASSIDDHIRRLKLDLRERLAICLIWGVDVATDGHIKTLSFRPADNTSLILTALANSLTGANAQSLLDLAQTWNTTGVPTAIKLAITDTASGAAAKLMDLLVGGATKFSIDKSGAVVCVGIASSGAILGPAGVVGAPGIAFSAQPTKGVYLLANEWALSSLLNMVDNILLRPELKDYSETVVPVAASELNFELGNYQTIENTGARTITVINPPATGKFGSMVLKITAGAGAVTDWDWPGTFKWPGGVEIVLTTTSGKIDRVAIDTDDGGTSYIATVLGQAI